MLVVVLKAWVTVRSAQKRRRMHRHEHPQPARQHERIAAVFPDGDGTASETLGGGRAEGDDKARLQHLDLGEKPSPADIDLARAGALVQPEFSAPRRRVRRTIAPI